MFLFKIKDHRFLKSKRGGDVINFYGRKYVSHLFSLRPFCEENSPCEDSKQ